MKDGGALNSGLRALHRMVGGSTSLLISTVDQHFALQWVNTHVSEVLSDCFAIIHRFPRLVNLEEIQRVLRFGVHQQVGICMFHVQLCLSYGSCRSGVCPSAGDR